MTIRKDAPKFTGQKGLKAGASDTRKDRGADSTRCPIQKTLPESDRARRSAVDQEILRYLGVLPKKDLEGFAYPSTRRVAEKIQRTPFYVKQRIRFLQRIGRLIPAKRERHNRTVDGWIVLRYKTWVNAQPSPEAPARHPTLCLSRLKIIW